MGDKFSLDEAVFEQQVHDRPEVQAGGQPVGVAGGLAVLAQPA